MEFGPFKGMCPLHEHLYTCFEGLFIGDDGSKLDIGKMSNTNMDAVLLDCLMYDDDTLFERAMALLYRKYQRRGNLLQKMNQVIIFFYIKYIDASREIRISPFHFPLPSHSYSASHQVIMQDDERLPVFNSLEILEAELQNFMYDIRTYAVWGVANQISGPLDDELFEEVITMHKKVKKFLEALPTEKELASGKGKSIRRSSSAMGAAWAGGGQRVNQKQAEQHPINRDYQEISRALNLHKVGCVR